ncbi:MAG: hypothetical protein EA385_14585 [Salinarimonadaceae bacterium]|nr:MAG: hypothetical protein EA385_14585 [Salinarimonadaceae bacterium]
MFGYAAKPILRCVTTALLALCLIALGFAHHPPGTGAPASQAAPAQASAGINLSHHALPDGTIPDLCLTLHADANGEHGRHSHDHGHGEHEGLHCPACALTNTIPAKAPAAITRDVAYAPAYFAPVPDAGALPNSRTNHHWARGPPRAARI